MIRIHWNSDENILQVRGHAGYEEAGRDIVCASVSSILTTSINAMLRFSPSSLNYQEENGKVMVKILENSHEWEVLNENMMNLFEELEQSYPDNIKIIK